MKNCNLVYFRWEDKTEGHYTAWETWRHAGIGPDDGAIIMGENPWETREDLLRRKASPTPEQKPTNPAMERGRKLRPLALDAYRKHCGIKTLHTQNMELKNHTQILAHPVFDRKTLHLAAIYVGERALEKALKTAKLPQPYWAEAQHTLMVSGLKFLNVFIYDERPNRSGKTFKVFQDASFQKDMLGKELNFLKEVQEARKQLTGRPQPTQAEKAALAQATRNALLKKTWVERDTYKLFVPSHFDRKGNPTDEGKKLLEAAAVA